MKDTDVAEQKSANPIAEIEAAFPRLSERQREQLAAMMTLYPEWNAKINVISRKDIENLAVNHILHSLAIAKFIEFAPGSRVMDLGTGGGFPGIPLAVMFPEVKFHLVDRIGKKLKVAEDVARQLGLTNVTVQHGDAAECKGEFDFVVSRAVMPQPDLVKIVRRHISKTQRNGLPNGLITLKGGELGEELRGLQQRSEEMNISCIFPQPFFETKKIVYTSI